MRKNKHYVHRWHNGICRKSQGINKIFLKLVSKYNKVTEYKVNTEVSCCPIYQEWTSRVQKKMLNITHNGTPKDEIVRSKSNWICMGSIKWKLQSSDGRRQGRSKEIEKYFMCIEWKIQYC